MKRFIFLMLLFLPGCVMTGSRAGTFSYLAPDYPPVAIETVAEDMADSLAGAYPPGRVTLFIDSAADELGAAFDSALRSRGFTLAADQLGAALTVTYVFDRLDETLCYSRFSVSDGLTVTRIWRQSGDSLIAEASSRKGNDNGQAR